MSGISRRLIASYVLVTVAVVVLVEVFVFGYQVPRLVNNAQLNAQVRGSAANYWDQLTQRYPTGVPAGALLGDTGQRPDAGTLRVHRQILVQKAPAVVQPLSPRPEPGERREARDGQDDEKRQAHQARLAVG